MAGYKSGGGGFDWNPMAILGSGLLEGLFGGMSKDERTNLRLQNEFQRLQNEMKRRSMGRQQGLWGDIQGQMANPGRFMAQQQSALTPYMNRYGSNLAGRLGTDSGAFQGAMAKKNYGMMNEASLGHQSELMRYLMMLAGG